MLFLLFLQHLPTPCANQGCPGDSIRAWHQYLSNADHTRRFSIAPHSQCSSIEIGLSCFTIMLPYTHALLRIQHTCGYQPYDSFLPIQ
jgi:hypothetical protein